ncbi:hypothetical protein JCM24511_08479 [Saitozyma sp. JCM 24511]|nr:hypothetical protein JCM24511_08479 [Saitozyma sp. JCM 24511]
MKSFLAKLKGDKKNKSTTTTPSTPTKPTAAPATSAPAPTTTTTNPTTAASAAFIADMTEKSESFFKAIEARRTYYALKPETTLTDAQLQSIVERAVKHTPTSFNMQHTRAVLVTKDVKNKVWDTIKEIKTKDETEDHAKATSEKIDNVFKAGYGTVLFFSDESVVNGWGSQMPMYAEAFKVWDAHASGMLQYNVWTALELEGHGANLQHLAEGSEPIQEGIRKVLGLPDSWHNSALLNFGVPAAPAGDKQFAPIEERVKVVTSA